MSELIQNIERGLRLLHDAGEVAEIRAFTPAPFKTTVSGFYDDPAVLAVDAAAVNASRGGLTTFVTLNPIRATWQAVNNTTYAGSAVLKSTMNSKEVADSPRLRHLRDWETGQMFHSIRTTEAGDILCRKWLLLDVDAGQPAECNSSDAEKANAYKYAQFVIGYLEQLGFPKPAFCDSGNGFHVLVRVDMPNTNLSTCVVRQFLSVIASKFDGSFGAAHVDVAVCDPNRIVKIYGSKVFKGAATEERPHRYSKVIYEGDQVVATAEMISAVTGDVKASVFSFGGAPVADKELAAQVQWVCSVLDFYGVDHADPTEDRSFVKMFVECPNSTQHTVVGESGTMVTIARDGALGFHCSHDHCQHFNTTKSWSTFVKVLEERFKEDHPDRLPFGTVIVRDRWDA